jgi:Cu(I)-responsive transcriptional regulator
MTPLPEPDFTFRCEKPKIRSLDGQLCAGRLPMAYPMNIGEAAMAAGVTAKMIRHYESLGLIPEAARTDAGYRQYTARDVAVLRFVRQSRGLGFSMKQIAQLLALWADTNRESREVKELASRHIAELDRKMQEMAQMKAALEELARQCRGDDHADCAILADLSNGVAPTSAALPTQAPAKRTRSAPESAGRTRHDAHHGLVAWMQSLSEIRSSDQGR